MNNTNNTNNTMNEGGAKINGARFIIVINAGDANAADKSVTEIENIITESGLKIKKCVENDTGMNREIFITVKGDDSKDMKSLAELFKKNEYEIKDQTNLILQ